MRRLTYWLSLFMIFMVPWEGLVEVPGVGTVSRLVGFVVAGLWLWSVVCSGRIRRVTPFHFFVFLFFSWNAISILWSSDIDQTLSQTVLYARMAGLILVIWNVYDTPASVRAGLQAFVLGSFVPVGDVIHNFVVGNVYGFTRYSATGSDPNTAGILIAFATPVALYLGTVAHPGGNGNLMRVVNYAYVPAALFAIALTATRFALVMTVPALVFGLVSLSRLKVPARALISAGLLGTLAFLPSLVPDTSLTRLSSTLDEVQAGDLNGRTALWKEGLSMWVDRPILGIGSDAFPSSVASIYGRPRSIHSSFVAVLVETGLVGLILLGVILGTAAYQVRYLPKWEARLWMAMLVVWALGNSVMTWMDQKSTWLLLSLLVASAANRLHQPLLSEGRAAPLRAITEA